MQGACIASVGSAVPDLCISNEEISQIVETSDKWITTRTGIKERRILTGRDKSVVELASLAALKALSKICMNPREIDLIILATSSPNDLFGSASQVQAKIGAIKAVAFDLTAACSGFVLAIVTATQFIQNGSYKNILVIGADVLSKWIDWSDRTTCILFGDGAGAVIMQACSQQENSILGFQLNTDGKQFNQLSIRYAEDDCINDRLKLFEGKFQHISMNGKEVYKFAVSKVPASITKCLKAINLSAKDISWLLLHQANKRILDAVADRLSINTSKIIVNLSKYGNTSAASIPLALDEALTSNKIFREDIVVISGFGAGLTWGTVVIKWKC